MNNRQHSVHPPIGGDPPTLNRPQQLARDLDTHHPQFFPRLEQCALANQKLVAISHNPYPALIQFCQKLPWIAVIVWQLLRLYFLPSTNAEQSQSETP
jgi:hypothetical protein